MLRPPVWLILCLVASAGSQEAVDTDCCTNEVQETPTPELREGQEVDLEAACPELSGQIIGGRPSSVTRHPYQVSMVLNRNSFCGGFIISRDYVITAAHCVRNLKGVVAGTRGNMRRPS